MEVTLTKGADTLSFNVETPTNYSDFESITNTIIDFAGQEYYDPNQLELLERRDESFV
jgi:hypothetical protein